MPQYSHSKLETFKNCRLQYRYRYIDKVKVEIKNTVEAFLGNMVHEALEKLYKDLRYEKRLKVNELVSCYKKRWKEEWDDSILIVNKDYKEANYRKMGERYIRDYYNRYQPFDQGKILGLETQNFLSLDEEGQYKYHIRIDRLMDMGDGAYEVHDYKTNNNLPAQEDLDKDRQLAMYSLWVRERYKDFQNVRLVWHFVAFDKEMDSFRTEKQLEALRKDTLKRIADIEKAKDFRAKVTNLCHWCEFKDLCPQWKHEVKTADLPENEFLKDPGVKLVDEYVEVKSKLDAHKKEAEAKLEKLKEALISFCKKEGIEVVTGSKKKVSISEYESVKYPVKNSTEREELDRLLKELGKWEEVSDLNIYELMKALDTAGWNEKTRAMIREFESREKKYGFSVSKKD